jgi:hypothetical protein
MCVLPSWTLTVADVIVIVLFRFAILVLLFSGAPCPLWDLDFDPARHWVASRPHPQLRKASSDAVSKSWKWPVQGEKKVDLRQFRA